MDKQDTNTKRDPLHPKSAFHCRGYLPHLEAGKRTQFVTFGLADSIPADLVRQWPMMDVTQEKRDMEIINRIGKLLDEGRGECVLADERAAVVMADTLKFHNGQRYRLHAWVVMPNHVHVLFTPMDGYGLARIVHTWKSFSAHRINHVLDRHGRLWKPEYFDRVIRDSKHFLRVFDYILYNPVKAGLCGSVYDWKFMGWSLTGRW